MKNTRQTIWAAVFTFGLILLCIGLFNRPQATQAVEMTPISEVSQSQSEIGLIPIEDIRVGMRVPARNPEITDEERSKFVEPNEETWRFLRLELEKQNGGILKIEMIRPLEWIQEYDARVGGTVFLRMKELGAEGNANVLEVSRCPKIMKGEGQVVVSTFAHPSTDIVELIVQVGDQFDKIVGTKSHRFWSFTRSKFKPMARLEIGECLETRDKRIGRVVSVLPRSGLEEPVFNLEVFGEHVYHVGTSEYLVHNDCPQFTYVLRDENDEIIYVGITNNPTRRKAEHLRGYSEQGVLPKEFASMDVVEEFAGPGARRGARDLEGSMLNWFNRTEDGKIQLLNKRTLSSTSDRYYHAYDNNNIGTVDNDGYVRTLLDDDEIVGYLQNILFTVD